MPSTAADRALSPVASDPTSGSDQPDPAGPPATGIPSVRDQARRLYAELVAAGEPVTGAALARALGISDRYGQRLLAEFRAEAPADSRPPNRGPHNRDAVHASPNGDTAMPDREGADR